MESTSRPATSRRRLKCLLQLILVNSAPNMVALSPPLTLSHMAHSFSQLWGARMGNKDSVLQKLRICVLIADCCFRSWRCRNVGRWPLLHLSSQCCKPFSLQLKQLPGEFKDQHPFYFPLFIIFIFFLSSFPPLRTRHIRSRTWCEGT